MIVRSFAPLILTLFDICQICQIFDIFDIEIFGIVYKFGFINSPFAYLRKFARLHMGV